MAESEPHVIRRDPPWGPISISFLLLAIALVLIIKRQAEPMAGAVIGYVAAYWLPSHGPEVYRKQDADPR